MKDLKDRLVLPESTEFIDSLNFMLGTGFFAEIKQRLVPLALEIIRISLLGHTHPFETLRGLSDAQWEDLLENPYTPSAVNGLISDLEAHPKLQELLTILCQPKVTERLRIEWVYDLTVGRFENTVPYLYKEEELLKDWQESCKSARDSAFDAYNLAETEAQRALERSLRHGSAFSETAKKLFKLSFMAACRKIFVFFSGARETWVGSYTMVPLKLDESLISVLGGKSAEAQKNDRILLKFGLVDHVFYLKPTSEQLHLYAECVRSIFFLQKVQEKLCPFVTLAGDGVNFNLMADVFYRVYQPQRLRELHSTPKAALEDASAQDLGLPKTLFRQLCFVPLSEETVAFFNQKIQSLPRLLPFLTNQRTQTGLLRQRLYRGILDRILSSVIQETLLSLCRQWNPTVKTSEGSTSSLMAYAEAKASRVCRAEQASSPAGELARRRAILDELLIMLRQDALTWQKAMEKDSFVVDRSRHYFMTVLDKAISEAGSEEMRKTRDRDFRRVVCVVVE